MEKTIHFSESKKGVDTVKWGDILNVRGIFFFFSLSYCRYKKYLSTSMPHLCKSGFCQNGRVKPNQNGLTCLNIFISIYII